MTQLFLIFFYNYFNFAFLTGLCRCADTFFGGSISREQVAEVAVDSCLYSEYSSNKIIEIVATADARQVTTKQGLESVR